MRADISKYYLYCILSNLLFATPIVFVFYLHIGLSYTEIFICEALFSIGVAALEIPTGVIADRFGKKPSIILGAAAAAIANILCAIGTGFGFIALASLMLALGVALMSGADTALFYEILQTNGQASKFKKYQGTAKSISLITLAIASIVGGLIGSWSMRGTFFATALVNILFGFIVFTIRSVHAQKSTETSYKKIVTESIQLMTHSRWIAWSMAFSAIIITSFRILQPVIQTYMQDTKLPLQYFGIASAYFFLLAAYSSRKVEFFEKTLRGRSYLVLSAFLVLPLLILSSLQSKFGFLLFGFLFMTTSIAVVFIDHELLKSAPSDKHATILSFNSFISRILFALTSPLVGYSLGIIGLSTTLFLFSMILVILLATLLLLRPRTFVPSR